MQRNKYQSITIKRKLEIIDLVDKAPPGKKKKDIASEVGIPASTLSTILKNRDVLQASHAFGSSKKKRNRDPSRSDVDAALFQWFTAARAQSVPISGEILKTKAEELAFELDPSALWTCSSGWLSRWKTRHNITYKAVSGENAAVDQVICEDWKLSTLSPLLEQYDPNDIFNADETGLFWRLLPDKTHAVRGETCTGGKKSKERITLLVCANMTGTEKRPLLTIGKSKSPRCFQGIKQLPTEYDANNSAWMTSQIFEAWLRKWDTELTRKGRKVAVIVDNCPAHPHVKALQSIELLFLPPNTTSEIQPCDQGIIYTLKCHYRKNMVKRLIQFIDNGSPLAQFKITLLEALQMVQVAWESVTSDTVSNCFRKAGFTSQLGDEMDMATVGELSEEDVTLEFLNAEEPTSFAEYVSCDSDLQCAPMITTGDIAASFDPSCTTEDETDDFGDPLPKVSVQQANSAFRDIQAFLIRNSTNADKTYRLLRELEVDLLRSSNNACIQTSITDFFKKTT